MLLPASIYAKPPECPILWFSLNQYWENTANKAILDANGEQRRLSMREMFEMGGGLYRFGCDPRRLLSGEALRRRARMKPDLWRGLVRAARQERAAASEWCGTVDPMPLNGLTLERMDDALCRQPHTARSA